MFLETSGDQSKPSKQFYRPPKTNEKPKYSGNVKKILDLLVKLKFGKIQSLNKSKKDIQSFVNRFAT